MFCMRPFSGPSGNAGITYALMGFLGLVCKLCWETLPDFVISGRCCTRARIDQDRRHLPGRFGCLLERHCCCFGRIPASEEEVPPPGVLVRWMRSQWAGCCEALLLIFGGRRSQALRLSAGLSRLAYFPFDLLNMFRGSQKLLQLSYFSFSGLGACAYPEFV